jgi:hypothetical protein
MGLWNHVNAVRRRSASISTTTSHDVPLMYQ